MDIEYERKLIIKLRQTRDRKDFHEGESGAAEKELYKLQEEMNDYLKENNATSTKKYDDIGFAIRSDPMRYASYDKANLDEVIDFLEQEDGLHLIKNTINTNSLSSFLRERLKDGKGWPTHIISIRERVNVKVYKSKTKKQ